MSSNTFRSSPENPPAMWRRRGIALPSLIRILRPASSQSPPPTLPDGGAASRRACSSSVNRVACARVSSPPEEPLESVLSRPQTEALLETVSVETLPGDLPRVLVEEEPSKRLGLSSFKLLLYEIDVLGSFPLKCLFPSFPSRSRSKWWSVLSHHAFNELHRAP